MSQHVIQACDEGDGLWLPLTEYYVRSGVSTSTIRRKIKSNSIQYRLENGKYLILFKGNGISYSPKGSTVKMQSSPVSQSISTSGFLSAGPAVKGSPDDSALPFLDRAVETVRGAFEQTLTEKDARILLLEKQNQELRDRLNELRILVQALEEKYEVRY